MLICIGMRPHSSSERRSFFLSISRFNSSKGSARMNQGNGSSSNAYYHIRTRHNLMLLGLQPMSISHWEGIRVSLIMAENNKRRGDEFSSSYSLHWTAPELRLSHQVLARLQNVEQHHFL